MFNSNKSMSQFFGVDYSNGKEVDFTFYSVA